MLAPGDPVPSLRRMAPIVHTYRSGETGLFVNSYLVGGRRRGGRDRRAAAAVGRPRLPGAPRGAEEAAARRAGHAPASRSLQHDQRAARGRGGAGDRAPRRRPRDPREGRRQARPVGADVRRRVAGQRDVPEPDGGGRGVGRTRRPAVHRLGLRTLRERERDRLAAGRRRHGVRRRPGLQRHARLPGGRAHGRVARAIDRAEEALAGVRTLYVGHGPPAGPPSSPTSAATC